MGNSQDNLYIYIYIFILPQRNPVSISFSIFLSVGLELWFRVSASGVGFTVRSSRHRGPIRAQAIMIELDGVSVFIMLEKALLVRGISHPAWRLTAFFLCFWGFRVLKVT